MKKRTIFNLLLILFVLSFFVTPLGYESKILLQRIFASSVDIIPADKAQKIDFSWQLKDRNDVQFNYSQTEGKKPSFVYFFSSWRGISIADLYAVEKLYDVYKDKVDFYIITNEKPEPVEEMMQKRNFHFKVTYLIIGENELSYMLTALQTEELCPGATLLRWEGILIDLTQVYGRFLPPRDGA